MKAFDRLAALCVLLLVSALAAANVLMLSERSEDDRVYNVEINRAVQQISAGDEPDLSSFEYITGIYADDGSSSFYNSGSDYVIRKIGGTLYRIEYERI